MSWPFYLLSISSSVVIGIGWVGFARLYQLPIPFRWSGWLTVVWFLPALVAASLQLLTRKRSPGLIFFCESLAAAISASFGPMGGLSFHFGLAQGLFAEIAMARRRNLFAVAMGCALADLTLLVLHPALAFLREQPWDVWASHTLGVVVSSWLAAWALKKLYAI